MKKIITLIFCLCFAVLIQAQTATPPSNYPGHGTSSSDAYLISSLANLYWLATQVNSGIDFTGKYFKQTADIDASVTGSGGVWGIEGWTPIGGETTDFTGIYDGDGHTISGLYIHRTGASCVGLFGSISAGTVKNIGILNISITGSLNVGGLTGYLWNTGTVSNSYTTGSVSALNQSGGGLVGTDDAIYGTENNTVSQCYSNCTVSGVDFTGGLIGSVSSSTKTFGTITNCYATGSVISSGNYTGGLIGSTGTIGTVSNCHATGAVNTSGVTGAGGLIALSGSSTVNNCYATGAVTSTLGNSSYLGGLIGVASSEGTVSNCYATGAVTVGTNYVSGSGIYGKTIGGLIGSNSGSVSVCFATGATFGGDNIGGLIGFNEGAVSDCYSTGTVTDNGFNGSNIGGFIGINSSTINKCYSISSITSLDTHGGLIGVNSGVINSNNFWNTSIYTLGIRINTGTFSAVGKTTVEMQTQSTYTSASWDFTITPVWKLIPNHYPLFPAQVNTWDGSTWSASAPTASQYVLINGNYNNSGFNCYDLVVNPGKSVTISTGTLAVGRNLTLKSDVSGTASLINNGTMTVSGTISAERYMTGNKWHLVSPTAEGGSISTFIQTAGNAIPLSGSNYGMMDYNESTNLWKNYYTASTVENLTAGKGYSVRRTTDGIVTFTGTLTTGTKTVALTTTGQGWNCVGNPYPSAINMNITAHATNNFIYVNSSNLDPSYACVYVWDEDASYSGQNCYKVICNSGFSTTKTILAQNYVAPGQGFFVKANTSATNISFNFAMQSQQVSTAFKAPAVRTSWPGIALNVASADASSSAVITFNENMTKGLDPTYDAGLLRGTNGLSLYTRLLEDNGVDFAIQSLPENYNNLVIPVGVDCKDGGDITFSAETVDLPATCNVILEDRTTNTFTSLADGAIYNTTVQAGSTVVGRFYIRTSNNLTTGTSGVTAAISNLKAYTVNGKIIIEGEVNDQAIATLYNLQGIKVLVHSLQKGSLNTLSCSDLMSGIYMLTIQQNGETVTRKLIMK